MRWISDNAGLIASDTMSHLIVAVPAIVLSFVLSVPLGWVANRRQWSRATLITAAALLYAIPSLPLFIVLPLLIGTSVRSALNIVIALTIYGIALMVRSSADALAAVNPATLLAATAQGYSGWQRFWRVELPLAGPGLIAGLRVVTVSTVSLVTVSAVLGTPSLGMLFIDGFQRGILAEVLAGIVATAALALILDLAVVGLGRALLPWERVTR